MDHDPQLQTPDLKKHKNSETKTGRNAIGTGRYKKDKTIRNLEIKDTVIDIQQWSKKESIT